MQIHQIYTSFDFTEKQTTPKLSTPQPTQSIIHSIFHPYLFQFPPKLPWLSAGLFYHALGFLQLQLDRPRVYHFSLPPLTAQKALNSKLKSYNVQN